MIGERKRKEEREKGKYFQRSDVDKSGWVGREIGGGEEEVGEIEKKFDLWRWRL
jgi:hypothetical protein